MKTVILDPHGRKNCEGISRRDVLKVGAIGFFGLSLPQFLAMKSASAAGMDGKADAVILLWLAGGPSHLDTFDPKPDAPSEIRGEFGAIETNVSGIRISEHMPNTAKVMDKIALVRSLTSNIAAHEQASQYLLTGYKPLSTLEYPSYGSVVSKELGPQKSMPAYVAIPEVARAGQSGFLGGAYNAFNVPDPSAKNYRVHDINLPGDVDSARLTRRELFAKRMNDRFEAALPDNSVRAVDAFYERAYDLVNSTGAKKAFDISQESPATRELYGATTTGQGCLLARRLVESGARFVTISKGGWDTHANNFKVLGDRLLPELDQAYAALLTDLAQRGMLEKTLVLLMGEFGRTPKVNPRAGRDHWSRCRFVAFAGGGMRGGQVIGKSDEQGAMPVERPVSVEDVATTIYTSLGIDYSKQYVTPTGRPIHIASGGQPIRELWG